MSPAYPRLLLQLERRFPEWRFALPSTDTLDGHGPNGERLTYTRRRLIFTAGDLRLDEPQDTYWIPERLGDLLKGGV